MVSSVFKTLSEKRAELLGELAALHKLPSDDSGKLAIRLQAVESEESRVSTLLYDVEEIKEELERITGKAEKPVGNKPGDFDDIASLIPFLSQPEQREREGRLAEKVRIAAQLVKNDWQQLFDYGEGDLDCPMLTPEGVLSRSQDEDSTDE
jgi:hypothetical protein